MQVAMVRVGIDTGCGGIHGPLFQDGTFEFVPIPDGFGIDDRTYGNTVGRCGRALVEYFRPSHRNRMMHQAIHADPEFTTFTYGDPTVPKSGLRHLQRGDYLLFNCGLEGWDFQAEPALYLIGYFEVLASGLASTFTRHEIRGLFGQNSHVRHRSIFEEQKDYLVLVKGSPNSRLLRKAVPISCMGKDRSGRPIKLLSSEMQRIFGDFGGRLCIQRSPTRWVAPAFVERAVEFVQSLV